MKGLTGLLAMMFVLMGASVAFAGCDPDRWTNPNNPHFGGGWLPLGENMYANVNDAGVNSNGNVQMRIVTLLNEKGGPCTVGTTWEISCEGQAGRPLWMDFFYDSDYPTGKDHTEQGGTGWIHYDGNMPLGRAANQVCGRKNELQQLSP